MNKGNLIFQFIFLGTVLILLLPYLLAEPEPCIQKSPYTFNHQTNAREAVWVIEGVKYKVREGEIIGKLSRFK